MATPTINPAPVHHSHRNTGTGAGGPNSPQQPSRRSSAARGVSSPWTQVVRSGESEYTSSSPPPPPPPASCEQVETAATAESQFESSDNGSGGDGTNNNGAKKPAWNKPSNGATDVSPVMGAVSWPALSESTKASPKLPSSDPLKTLSDGSSVSVSQGTGMASASHRQANTNNVNPNTMLNHVVTSRQRCMKRGGGNSNHNNGGFSQQQAHGFEVDTVLNNSGKSGHSGTAESSSRDISHRDGGQWGSQSHGGNDHQHQRNANRRGNVGPHPRGDGTHHHGYGGRRDQERRNQDWKPHRSWVNRDAHMQPQRGPARPLMGPPPHTSPPFIPTPMPVQSYRAPMVFSEVPHVIYFQGPFHDSLRMPLIAPGSPVFLQVPDTQLHARIVNQIDYYFSNDNLIKDTFLRQNMDEHGWVPVTLIAGFKKVMELTDNIHLILNAVRSSTVVEVQGEKLRRRNDWFHWLMPPSVQNSTMSSPQSPQKSTPDLLVEDLQRFVFDYKTIRHGNAEAHLSRSSSTELSTPSKRFGNEMSGQAGTQHSQPMPVGNPS